MSELKILGVFVAQNRHEIKKDIGNRIQWFVCTGSIYNHHHKDSMVLTLRSFQLICEMDLFIDVSGDVKGFRRGVISSADFDDLIRQRYEIAFVQR